MKKKAMNALIEMGMPANLRGFKYIVEIIEKYEEDESWVYGKLTYMYEVIGKKECTCGKNVERCIRKAFETVLIRGTREVADRYLTRDNTASGNLLTVFYLRLQDN